MTGVNLFILLYDVSIRLFSRIAVLNRARLYIDKVFGSSKLRFINNISKLNFDFRSIPGSSMPTVPD